MQSNLLTKFFRINYVAEVIAPQPCYNCIKNACWKLKFCKESLEDWRIRLP